jgi:hypothetical protein
MCSSVIEIQLKPGKMDEATEMVRAMRPDLEQLNGLKQLVVIDHCHDKLLAVAIYEGKADQEAATPKAQELIGRLAELAAAPPERMGCAVTVNEVF